MSSSLPLQRIVPSQESGSHPEEFRRTQPVTASTSENGKFTVDKQGQDPWSPTTESTPVSHTRDFLPNEEVSKHSNIQPSRIQEEPRASPTADIVKSQLKSTTTENTLIGLPRRRPTILMLGATGVGKSSMTNALAHIPVEVGHGIKSCTTDCTLRNITLDDGQLATIIDTPGFGDTVRQDLDILQTISNCVFAKDTPVITGIMLLYRITDSRVSGTSSLILNLLRSFSGKHYYPYVMLVTTMWDTVANPQIFEERHQELAQKDYAWGDMTRGGSRTMKYEGTSESAIAIIKSMAQREPSEQPAFVIDISEKSLKTEETRAGQVLTAEVRRREEIRRREEEEEQAETRLELLATEQRIRAVTQQQQQAGRMRGQPDIGFVRGPSGQVSQPPLRIFQPQMLHMPRPSSSSNQRQQQMSRSTYSSPHSIQQGQRHNSWSTSIPLDDSDEQRRHHRGGQGRFQQIGSEIGKRIDRYL